MFEDTISKQILAWENLKYWIGGWIIVLSWKLWEISRSDKNQTKPNSWSGAARCIQETRNKRAFAVVKDNCQSLIKLERLQLNLLRLYLKGKIHHVCRQSHRSSSYHNTNKLRFIVLLCRHHQQCLLYDWQTLAGFSGKFYKTNNQKWKTDRTDNRNEK